MLFLDVEIGARPQAQDLDQISEKATTETWRGLEVEGLTYENKRRFRTQEDKGVIVVEVKPNSPADEAGVNPGEVILGINKEPINNISDYQRLTRDLKGDALIRTARGYFVIKEKVE
jgi:S1-C subfamily serine protease